MNNLCPPGYASPTKKLYNHAISWQISFKFCGCSSYGVMTIWVKFQENGEGSLTTSWELIRNGPKRVSKLFKLWTLNQCLCFFQLCAYLRMKFGNVEAIDRLQIRKKKYLAKRHLHREHWQVWILKGTKNAVNKA